MKNIIYTIGDSHCYEGWSNTNLKNYKVISNHLGPKLMYSIKLEDFLLLKIQPSKYDKIVFCLGEIDCRCHLYKYMGSLAKTIDGMVQIYFNMIEKYVKVLKSNNIFIYNVPPPSNIDNVTNNPEYPFRGTNDERKLIVRIMNEHLKHYCKSYNYSFIDIIDMCEDENGLLSKKSSNDGVHITNSKIISDYIDLTFV